MLPCPEGRSFRLRTPTRPAPHNAEFLLHRTPDFGGSSTGSKTVASTAEKLALARLVNSLKGVSARRLRAANLAEIRSKIWGVHFWSPSYCAVSCGGAPLEIVKRYVEKQRGASSPS